MKKEKQIEIKGKVEKGNYTEKEVLKAKTKCPI